MGWKLGVGRTFSIETNDHNDPGFIASDEAGAGPFHKQRVLNADYSDTVRTTIYTGRPMRSLARIFQFSWAKLGKTSTTWIGFGFWGVFVAVDEDSYSWWVEILAHPNSLFGDDWKSDTSEKDFI